MTSTGPYERLDELTAMSNGASAAEAAAPLPNRDVDGRRAELAEVHQRVNEARHDEVYRLMTQEGRTAEELNAHLDATDRWRYGPPEDAEPAALDDDLER